MVLKWVLGVETSTQTGSVALLQLADDGEGARLVGEVTLSISLQHAERLLPAVANLLRDAAVPLEAIDLFAVAHGPGSFTGIRVGIAAVQGFMTATGKPAVGVSGLEGLALNSLYSPGLIGPVLDARRGEVYAAIFRRSRREGQALLEVVCEEQAISPEDWVEELSRHPDEEILLIGEGAEKYSQLFRKCGKVTFAIPPLNRPRASLIALLGLRDYRLGVRQPLTPHYLRPPDTTFPKLSGVGR